MKKNNNKKTVSPKDKSHLHIHIIPWIIGANAEPFMSVICVK